MTWYENPSITGLIGALGGAILSAVVALFIWRKTRKLTRIDCAIDNPKSLLSFASVIGDKLEVKYQGKEATSVFLFPLEVTNTGTEPIENQPIQIQLSPGSRVLSYSTETEPDIGFGDISCVQKEDHRLHLSVALLNPGDRVLVEVMSLNNPDGVIEVGLKNKGVFARVYNKRTAESILRKVAGRPDILNMYVAFSLVPFFGAFGRALMTQELAKRIDRISEK